jgi:predicted metal-dependent phosphoesterase TrpH
VSRGIRRKARDRGNGHSASSATISFAHYSGCLSRALLRQRPATPGDAAGDVAKPAAGVDLHTHSTASDGSRTPREVAEAAANAGLTAIALTDHDTLSGFLEARDAGSELGLRVIAGVELSAHQDDHEIHILALHVERVEWLETQLEQFRQARGVRAARLVDRLRELGTDISLESVLEAAGPGSIGRPHIASVLISSGVVRDRREAFDRFLAA